MGQKNSSTVIIILLVILLLLIVGGGAYYLGLQKSGSVAEQTIVSISEVQPTIPFSTPVPTTVPTVISEETQEAGWQVYKNSQYGFQISYPSGYQALNDAENLYGWPKAVVLFYNGGQSYDLPVEVWDSEAEYQAKYPGTMNNLTVKRVGDKFITLLNTNYSEEVEQIIATLRVTN